MSKLKNRIVPRPSLIDRTLSVPLLQPSSPPLLLSSAPPPLPPHCTGTPSPGSIPCDSPKRSGVRGDLTYFSSTSCFWYSSCCSRVISVVVMAPGLLLFSSQNAAGLLYALWSTVPRGTFSSLSFSLSLSFYLHKLMPIGRRRLPLRGSLV